MSTSTSPTSSSSTSSTTFTTATSLLPGNDSDLLYNAAALRSKVAGIHWQKHIPADVGITLNSLYINPRQFTFQLPLWQEMRKEGLPIEGFCVAVVGIPTTGTGTEKAVKISTVSS